MREKKDFSYLKESGRMDFQESIRKINVKDLKQDVASPEEMVGLIDKYFNTKESDGSLVGACFGVERITNKEEIVILERLDTGNGLPGYDFYIARRRTDRGNSSDANTAFNIDTIILARRSGIDFIANYIGVNSGIYDRVGERFLPESKDNSDIIYKENDKIPVYINKIIAKQGNEAKSCLAYQLEEGQFLPQEMVARVLLKERDYVLDKLRLEENFFRNFKLIMDMSRDDLDSGFIVKPIAIARKKGYKKIPNVSLWECCAVSTNEYPLFMNLQALFVEMYDNRKKKILFETCMAMLKQIFRALRFLSDWGITNGDVCPINTVVTNKCLKLCDFGIATINPKKMASKNRERWNKNGGGDYLISAVDVGNLRPRVSGAHPDLYRFFGEINSLPKIRKPCHDVYSACCLGSSLLCVYPYNKYYGTPEVYFNGSVREEISELFSSLKNQDSLDFTFKKRLLTGEEWKKYGGYMSELSDLLIAGLSKDSRLIPEPADFIQLFDKMGIPDFVDVRELLESNQ